MQTTTNATPPIKLIGKTISKAREVGGMMTANMNAQIGRAAAKAIARSRLCHELKGYGALSGW